MPVKKIEQHNALVLEALHSLATGPLCFATNSAIAGKAGVTPASLGLPTLEGRSIERYFEEGTKRRFFVLLDHPEAQATMMAIDSGHHAAIRAYRYSTEDGRRDRDDGVRRDAHNGWLESLGSCSDINDFLNCTSAYCMNLSHAGRDAWEEIDYWNSRLREVYEPVDRHSSALRLLDELLDNGVLDEGCHEAAYQYMDQKLTTMLRGMNLDIWAQALESGDWPLIARARSS